MKASLFTAVVALSAGSAFAQVPTKDAYGRSVFVPAPAQLVYWDKHNIEFAKNKDVSITPYYAHSSTNPDVISPSFQVITFTGAKAEYIRELIELTSDKLPNSVFNCSRGGCSVLDSNGLIFSFTEKSERALVLTSTFAAPAEQNRGGKELWDRIQLAGESVSVEKPFECYFRKGADLGYFGTTTNYSCYITK